MGKLRIKEVKPFTMGMELTNEDMIRLSLMAVSTRDTYENQGRDIEIHIPRCYLQKILTQ
jgi:hypothetical protein